MATNSKTGVLCLFAAFFFFGTACAEEGAAQVGRAISDLAIVLRQGTLESLPRLVRECYENRQANSGVDMIAYCFALDYGSTQIDQASARKFGAVPQAYLSIEKVLTRANRALSAVKVEQAERGPLIAFWANSSRALLSKWTDSEPSSEAGSGPLWTLETGGRKSCSVPRSRAPTGPKNLVPAFCKRTVSL